MKKRLLCPLIGIFYFLVFGTAYAQFSRPISVGAGAGGSIGFTDMKSSQFRFAFYGEMDYLLSPFISVGIRGEKGELVGSNRENKFENKYYSANLNGKIRLGKFMNLPDNYSYYALEASTFDRILSNFYIGAGAGLMKNRIGTKITGEFLKDLVDMGGKIADDRSGIHFVIPLSVGLDLPFGRTLYGPKWGVNINYQHTLSMNDNFDGVVNGNNDQYGFVSLGVKYALFNRN